MRIIVNPTWRCNFSCPYCWVRAIGWHKLYKREQERDSRDWAKWIAQLPANSSIDFSGGEPLMYPHMVRLLHWCAENRVKWAITTNLSDATDWRGLTSEHIPGCLAVNVSVHPQSPKDLAWRVEALRNAGYPAYVNTVIHPDAPKLGSFGNTPVHRIPYQPWQEQMALDGKQRVCTAGVAHVACDPLGRVYRCLVAMQTGQEPLGTIDQPLQETLLKESTGCDFGCSTCYTDSPGAWAVVMKELSCGA